VGEAEPDSLVGAECLCVVLKLLGCSCKLFKLELTCVAQSPIEVTGDIFPNSLMSIVEIYANPFIQCCFH
jgi:hypothetical protein